MDSNNENQVTTPVETQTPVTPTQSGHVEAQHTTDAPAAVDYWAEDVNMDGATTPTVEKTATAETDTTVDEQSIDYNDLYDKQLKGETGKQLDTPILLNHKGKIIDISDSKELRSLAELGLSATAKFQDMAEQRKMLDGISPEDITMLRQLKSGDQSVIAELSTQRESNEVTDNAAAIETTAQTVLDSNYATEFKSMLGSMNSTDSKMVSTDPRIFKGLQMDFEKGIAQKVMPLVERNMAVKGMSFMEAYTTAGKEMFSGDRQKVADDLSSQPSANSSVTTTPKQDAWGMDTDSFNRLMARGR